MWHLIQKINHENTQHTIPSLHDTSQPAVTNISKEHITLRLVTVFL